MDHTRHADIFRAEDLSITLIGAGGIGASAAVTLAKMGVGNLTVWDDDAISEVNLPTQLHMLSDLGRPKVRALAELVSDLSDDTHFVPVLDRVTPIANWGIEDYTVISAVDSIAARKGIWQVVKQGKVRWYLDARMAAEEFHLHTVDMLRSQDWYENILAAETDENVPDLPCTSRATFFCSMLSAAIIGRTARMIASGLTPPRIFTQNLITDVVISIR